MTYQRITELDPAFTDVEAASVESLRRAWVEQKEGLATGGALADFNGRLVRRWAIETGILERLYTVDRGTTEVLVVRGLDASLIEHGASDLPAAALVEILRDHEDAAAYVLDHVAQQHDLSLHFIRSLHALLTRNQDFVEVEDNTGRRLQAPLLKGQWKQLPNNPRRPDGTVHAYCPPELVEEEMQALLTHFHGALDRLASPVIAAAWLHHRFTQIHPFQDGNGRVARALTAFALVKAGCFPIVIDRDQRAGYIAALEAADASDLRPLVRFFAALEKQELQSALSLSEDALARASERPVGTMREKLLAALKDKAHAKRSAITAQRQRVRDVGANLMRDMVRPAADRWGREVQEALEQDLRGSAVTLEWSTEQTRHWFKFQIVRLAEASGYYCDIETFHEWTRLKIRRPDESEDRFSELVISMHSLGRPFTGVLAVSAYFAMRVLDDDGRSQTMEPKPLSERPMTFSSFEAPENVRERMETWLTEVLDKGLAELARSL